MCRRSLFVLSKVHLFVGATMQKQNGGLNFLQQLHGDRAHLFSATIFAYYSFKCTYFSHPFYRFFPNLSIYLMVFFLFVVRPKIGCARLHNCKIKIVETEFLYAPTDATTRQNEQRNYLLPFLSFISFSGTTCYSEGHRRDKFKTLLHII